jgi:hypothetical protein
MTQQIKLQIPNGYEIDLENSTAEEIALKPIKKQLPKTWEELGEIHGYWVEYDSKVFDNKGSRAYSCCVENRDIFVTEAQAKASIAMAQLSQLREVYRQGWKPKSYKQENKELKYTIINNYGQIIVGYTCGDFQFLSFQSQEIAEEFLTNFKDLIIEAAPLLFGEEIEKH